MARGACFEQRPECQYAPKCYSDTHHLYYPKSDYKRSVERQFRELPENKLEVCRDIHDEIHATEEPPIKPSRQEMLGAISMSNVEVRT